MFIRQPWSSHILTGAPLHNSLCLQDIQRFDVLVPSLVCGRRKRFLHNFLRRQFEVAEQFPQHRQFVGYLMMWKYSRRYTQIKSITLLTVDYSYFQNFIRYVDYISFPTKNWWPVIQNHGYASFREIMRQWWKLLSKTVKQLSVIIHVKNKILQDKKGTYTINLNHRNILNELFANKFGNVKINIFFRKIVYWTNGSNIVSVLQRMQKNVQLYYEELINIHLTIII